MYIVYRDVITTLIFGLVSFTIMSIFSFSEAFVGEIQHCLPEAICCYITRFTEILSQHCSLGNKALPSHLYPHVA